MSINIETKYNVGNIVFWKHNDNIVKVKIVGIHLIFSINNRYNGFLYMVIPNKDWDTFYVKEEDLFKRKEDII